METMTREEYVDRTHNWFYCDNIVHEKHKGQFGLLHLADPMVFVLVRDDNTNFRDFEDFKKHCAELSFLHPQDRKEYNEEEVLIDAYNFCVLQEYEEKKTAEQNYE